MNGTIFLKFSGFVPEQIDGAAVCPCPTPGVYSIVPHPEKESLSFSGCKSLTSIDLSNFNTNNVKDMSYMFDGCSSLTSLNLSNFNTNNVNDMYAMFDGCSSLTSLNTTDKRLLNEWKKIK